VPVSIAKTGIASGSRNVAVHRDTTPPANVSGLDKTVGNGQTVLTWTDPADADFDHVEITWEPGGSSPQTVPKGTESYTASLTNGSEYTFTVKTVDTAGNKSNGAAAPEAVPEAGGTGDAGETGEAGGTGETGEAGGIEIDEPAPPLPRSILGG
jgi:predicted phage tail protein